MAKQRYINTRFWDDGYVVTLDPIEKLLFLYFLTNPLTEICGAYEIQLKRVALDTGIDRDMVLKILNRFEDEDKIIYRDGWILVNNFIKHQSVNPKVQIGIEKSVKGCPDWVRDRLSIAYDSLSHLNLSYSNSSKALPDEKIPTPLSPSFPNSESMSGRPRGFRGVPVNEDAEARLILWLDAIAPALGAKSRHTIADIQNWTDVCIKAISEGRTSTELVEAIHAELERTADTPQYFSAKGVLKRLQTATAKPARRKFIH